MKNEIEDLINSKLDEAVSFEDIYDIDVESEIDEKIKKQNQTVELENYRIELLKRLKELSNSNNNIVYDENLSIEEIERILNEKNF